ncbi:MAG TPA: CRTAC1 family protein, partial [Polyangiaceae bacterium]
SGGRARRVAHTHAMPHALREARRYLGMATGALLLGSIVGGKHLQATSARAHEPHADAQTAARASIRFEEIAARAGIDDRHELFFPNPAAGTYLPLMAIPPAVAVADFDGDGRMDLFVTHQKPGSPNHLWKNLGGGRFVDVAKDAGLDDAARTQADSMALVADFDGDGRVDVFQSRFGCHTLFTQDPDRFHFTEHQELLPRYCSNPKAINLVDFNRDGWLDVVFGNYYPAVDLATVLPLNHVFGFAGANYQGGEPHILFGGPAGFREAPAYELPELKNVHGHTTAVGVSDVDGDGWPDLFLSNDYTYDVMLLNRFGKHVFDVTDQYIPRREHGFSGMNGEFADFDDEGRMGLFVSNMFIPPFVTNRNILWKNRGDHFENVASERGVGRCGWAWTAKFGDFDDDGDLDLFVVNGKARGANVARPTDPHRSFAFVRNTIATLPAEVRWNLALYPSFADFELSAFEPSCVFWNDGGHFVDVAEQAGVHDLEEGQSAALIDFDDDGRLDVVVANLGGPLLLYHDVTPRPGHWVGLELVGKNGAKLPVGTKAWLHRPDGKVSMRELYPANGYRGQSDPRVHYGLGELTTVPDVEVRWPDHRREFFRGLQPDRYQLLRYGEGSSR